MITVNIPKAKEIAHKKRRAAREKEFAPYDNIIMKQIPGTDATDAENARKLIRIKYMVMQGQIDAATNIEQIVDAAGAVLNEE